jgi:hypothetical protein
MSKKVELPTALSEIALYREVTKLFDFPSYVNRTKACHIRREDLMEMLEISDPNPESPIHGIRCYFGMRLDNDTTTPIVTSLVMVGTTLNEDGDYKDNIAGNIYEFTTPCPDSCDFESVLFLATQ